MAGVDPSGTVIIDCLAIWVSNRMLEDPPVDGAELVAQAAGLAGELAARPGLALVVTNEVGSGVVPATSLGRNFRDLLGMVNQGVVRAAGSAFLVVAGRLLPLVARPTGWVTKDGQSEDAGPGRPNWQRCGPNMAHSAANSAPDAAATANWQRSGPYRALSAANSRMDAGVTAESGALAGLLADLPGPDGSARDEVAARAATVLRPAGAFARLDAVAAWLAGWQGTAAPRVERPMWWCSLPTTAWPTTA